MVVFHCSNIQFALEPDSIRERVRVRFLFIGNSDEVAEKINTVKEMFGLTRYIAHMDVGAPNHEVMMKSIELFGTKVSEKVR